MKFFRFDRATGSDMSQFSTKNVLLSRIAKINGEVEIGVLHLGPRGEIGYHQAAVPQLFMVVQGACYVKDHGNVRRALTVGQAVFWDKGEWHEAASDYGLVAIVIESEQLDPAQLMRELM